MKALKGLLIYIGIVLASILGIAIILFAIMYFVPSFRIFGVGVVHSGKSEEGTLINFSDYSGYSNIELNISSKKIPIYLNNSESDSSEINYNWKKNIFGIAFDITDYKVLKDVEINGATLKINLIVTEPEGWISSNSSSFSITLPKSFDYSLLINTTSGNVKIGNSVQMFNIKNLTVSTTSGNFELNPSDSESSTDSNFNTLNLSTTSGKYDFSSTSNLVCNNTIKLEGDNGTFNFKKVNASFNVTGKGIKLDADEIVTDIDGFKFVSENGFFKIGKIVTMAGTENTIVTENCDVKIDEVSGKTGIITTYGNINIGLLNDYATLQSEHGNVSIKKAKNDLRISTTFGNITVDAYESNAQFVSVRGNINVKSTGEYKQGTYTRIENTDGAIVVDNKVNRLLVTTYGSSNVEITYREIKGGLTDPLDVFQHKVNLAKLSSAVIYMPTNNYKTPFKFIAKGDISGEISGLVPEYGGDQVKSSDDFQYFPEASRKEECQQSCYFEFYGTIKFQGYLNV